MEAISTFDMLKIGIGPSSSHTLGPWRAAEYWIKELKNSALFDNVISIKIHLYGSLSLTGKGHASDYALMLGLSGQDPEYTPTTDIHNIVNKIKKEKELKLNNEKPLKFNPKTDIIFEKEFLPFHPNGITFKAQLYSKKEIKDTYYSIGGGFVIKEELNKPKKNKPLSNTFPFSVVTGKDLLQFCQKENKAISEIVLENERSLRTDSEIDLELNRIWNTMLECMYTGCHTEGKLPGGLNVTRRAFEMHNSLKGDLKYNSPEEWLEIIKKTKVKFRQIFTWVSCFALAVNEVNASLGRLSLIHI